MASKRRYPCRLDGCSLLAAKAGGYCSKSCAARGYLATRTPEQRSAHGRRMAQAQVKRMLARMLVRVKVLADREDDRIVLAYRAGLLARNTRKRRTQQTKQGEAA
jgi:hypothetical protein